MKTWSYIWAIIALTGLAATVFCGINWALIPSAIGALMYVACTVEHKETEEEGLL